MVDRRWLVLLGVILLIAGGRYWQWRNQWPTLVAGQRVSLADKVRFPVDVRWGKQYVRLGRGGEIEVEVPGGVTVDLGDQLEVVGTIENRLIGEKLNGFRLIYSHFNVKPASEVGRVIAEWRKTLMARVESWLPGDEGGLAAGILWGGSEGISEKGSENFRKAGITHIVAASGYNVTVVAGWAMAIGLRLFGRKLMIYFGLVSVVLYVLLAGAQAAVVRAGIMAGLALVALARGRQTETVWVWLLAGMGMVIAKPEYLEDIGWQLLMVATGGLVFLRKGGRENLLVADLKTTLAAQVTTLPIIAHYFGGVSVIAPAVNVLVLWTVPMIMEVVMMATVVGLVGSGIGMVASWAAWPLLRWVTWVTDAVGNWGWSSLTVGEMGWGWVAVYYATVIFILNFRTVCRAGREVVFYRQSHGVGS